VEASEISTSNCFRLRDRGTPDDRSLQQADDLHSSERDISIDAFDCNCMQNLSAVCAKSFSR